VTVSNKYHQIEISQIKIPENRQRKSINQTKIKELADSIERHGLFHPIIIDRQFNLITGKRRIEALKLLERKTIYFQFFDLLHPLDTKIVELEENVKRTDLTWKEAALALLEYHEIKTQMSIEEGSPWTTSDTAKSTGYSLNNLTRILTVAKELGTNPQVDTAENFEAAHRVVSRAMDRAIDTEMSQLKDILESSEESTDEEEENTTLESIFSQENSVLVDDFNNWARNYSGRRFNFVHCDFPYGINYGKTKYSGSETWKKYDDSKNVFDTLLDTLLTFRNTIFFPSSHLIFWFSMPYYTEVFEQLTLGGFSVNPVPLIWYKGNTGLVPDSMRGPRRVYEAAFLASLGDRKIVKPIANVKEHPVTKKGHISAKPEPMLKHFFSMLVEEQTEMLDPTCGSGSSLAAATSLGAKSVLGLDVVEEYVEFSRTMLKRAQQGLIAEEEKATE